MLAFFFSPSGRIGRAQWWLAQIAVLVIVIVVIVLMSILQGATIRRGLPMPTVTGLLVD